MILQKQKDYTRLKTSNKEICLKRTSVSDLVASSSEVTECNQSNAPHPLLPSTGIKENLLYFMEFNKVGTLEENPLPL